MSFPIKHSSIAAVVLACLSGSAHASDASDIARISKVPASVVDSVLTNVDAYFTSADAPSNRMVSGILKDLVLKVVKNRLGGLDDAAPGKSSDSTYEDKNAIYRAVVRTTSHNTSETRDCVENKVVISSSEGVPVIKDGLFGFDTIHPRTTNWGWSMTFCRTASSNGDFGEWQLATDGK